MEKEQSMKFPYNFLFDIMENYNGKYNNLPNDILGTTMYIEQKFAKSSTAPMDKRYPLLDSVDEMFKVIKSEKGTVK